MPAKRKTRTATAKKDSTAHLQSRAKLPSIGKDVDDGMDAESAKLEAAIRNNLQGLGYGI